MRYQAMLGLWLLFAAPAWAASPSPRPLPITGVSVDLEHRQLVPGLAGGIKASHVERPPFPLCRVRQCPPKRGIAPASLVAPASASPIPVVIPAP